MTCPASEACQKLLCEEVTICHTGGGQKVTVVYTKRIHNGPLPGISWKDGSLSSMSKTQGWGEKHGGGTRRATHEVHHDKFTWETFAYVHDSGEDAGAPPTIVRGGSPCGWESRRALPRGAAAGAGQGRDLYWLGILRLHYHTPVTHMFCPGRGHRSTVLYSRHPPVTYV